MQERILLTPKQVAVIHTLNERNVEATPTEVAVSALLSPTEVRGLLNKLEASGFVVAADSRSSDFREPSFELTTTGRLVGQALEGVVDANPVGSIVRLPRTLPRFLTWLSRNEPTYIEIVDEDKLS